ncbi:MAG: hypothetical protein ACRDRA_10585 [Pseudonocardiaceae bacterium]
MNRHECGTPSGRLLMPADVADAPGRSGLDPVMSRQDAARVLCELFLTNAEQRNHAANDELVAELVRRIRVRQHSPHHHDDQSPAALRGSPMDPGRVDPECGSVR